MKHGDKAIQALIEAAEEFRSFFDKAYKERKAQRIVFSPGICSRVRKIQDALVAVRGSRVHVTAR